MVTDQPATEADQNRRPRRASRPRHRLSTCGSCGHRHYVARHPHRHPPIASATAMRVTTSPIQTERKRQDRSVRRAEKHRCRAGMMRVHRMIRRAPSVCATADAARGEKHLIGWPRQATMRSDGTPLGECRLTGLGLTSAGLEGAGPSRSIPVPPSKEVA